MVRSALSTSPAFYKMVGCALMCPPPKPIFLQVFFSYKMVGCLPLLAHRPPPCCRRHRRRRRYCCRRRCPAAIPSAAAVPVVAAAVTDVAAAAAAATFASVNTHSSQVPTGGRDSKELFGNGQCIKKTSSSMDRPRKQSPGQ